MKERKESEMARRQMTKDQIAARTAKAKATREAKKKAALEMLGLDQTRSKVRKPRKKMTDEQRVAASERLKKAREKKGPSENKFIDESVRLLDEEHPLSLVNTRKYIKHNKELLHTIRDWKQSKDSKERIKFQEVDTYIHNLESYLRNGVYLNPYYGLEMENKIKHRVVAMAYNSDGTPKRTVGCYYPDVGLYTQEMANEERINN